MPESQTRDRLVQQSLRVSRILCFVTMFLSLVTAVGWIGGVPLLTQGHPSLPVMHPNTALGLRDIGRFQDGDWKARFLQDDCF